MMGSAFTLKVDSESFAELIMDVPDKPVNVLSTPVMMELDQRLTDISERQDSLPVRILRKSALSGTGPMPLRKPALDRRFLKN